MKTLFRRFSKEPISLHIVFDVDKSKLFIVNQEKLNYSDNNLNLVFTLSSYLIGMLRMVGIPFVKVKRLLLIAIDRDLREGKQFDVNSYTYDLLLNQFKIVV